MDNLAQRKEKEFGGSQKRLEISLSPGILRAFSFFVLFAFFILLGRSVELQFIQAERYAALARHNILSISTTQLLRGIVYDRNYNQLVYNSPSYELRFKNGKKDSLNTKVIGEVAEIIGFDKKELEKRLAESGSTEVVVKRGLEHGELVKFKAREGDFPGFFLSSAVGREYRSGEAFSHILGYVGKIDRETLRERPEKYTIHDYVGKAGIERFYEDYLTRVGERIKVERDAAGNIRVEEIIEESQDGKNLVLTVDAELQETVFEKTKEKLKETGSRKAAVVAINPQTGEVLSMVSLPSFDNNLFKVGTEQKVFEDLFQNRDGVFLNRVTSAAYPTGSVIKPLLAIAALEEGIITPEKQIYSPGYITVPNPWNPAQPTIFRDFQAHGWRNMREAIAVSSNVYFYAVGGGYEDQEGLGARRIKEYLSLFGWGEKTSIDISGEKEGFVPTPEWKADALGDIWRQGDTYNLSIGQGHLSVTPLQVANSLSVIANGGKLFNPYIVKEIIDDEGKALSVREPEVIREGFLSSENLRVAKEGMGLATRIGTSASLQALPVSSGAKTGTAQTSKPGINHSWVTVFAPYDDPEILVTVIIEDVKGVTPVATHLARDILLEYFKTE